MSSSPLMHGLNRFWQWLLQDWQQPNRDMHQELSAFSEPIVNHLKPIQWPEDVKNVYLSAESLTDVWQFFLKRLRNGTEPDLVLLSVVDERSQQIIPKCCRLWQQDSRVFSKPISMGNGQHHLVQAMQRQDTTFMSVWDSFQLDPSMVVQWPAIPIFSVPFLAKGKCVAILTLGFSQLDTLSQAQLSSIYSVRDVMAQVIWNVWLQERWQQLSQLDGLTSCLRYSSWMTQTQQQIEQLRWEKQPISLVRFDISPLSDINQQMGLAYGDLVITQVAQCLGESLPNNQASVARVKGSRFVVTLPGWDKTATKAWCGPVIESLQSELKRLNLTSRSGAVTMECKARVLTVPDDIAYGSDTYVPLEQLAWASDAYAEATVNAVPVLLS